MVRDLEKGTKSRRIRVWGPKAAPVFVKNNTDDTTQYAFYINMYELTISMLQLQVRVVFLTIINHCYSCTDPQLKNRRFWISSSIFVLYNFSITQNILHQNESSFQ